MVYEDVTVCVCKGNVYLYVINHHPVETVDKFLFDPSAKTLTHQRRITADPNFHR